jgi:hypothetical protein
VAGRVRVPSCLLITCALAWAQAEGEGLEWRVLAHDPINVAPRSEADAELEPRAEALIDRLRGIDTCHDGIRDDGGGGPYFHALDKRAPAAFRELVRLGPAAMPALLDHVNDARTTKLKFSNWGGFGGVLAFAEIPVPFGRSKEVKVIASVFPEMKRVTDWEKGGADPVDLLNIEHAITVGDVCFAILGQIVNRPYEAARYQPTGITVVCSPTRDPRIAKALRAWWGAGDPRKLLARSLLDDFFTRGPDSDHLQAGAAARLLVYFPEEAGSLVAARVAALKSEDRTFRARRERVGIEEGLFLRRVLATGHSLVRARWLELLDTKRPELLLTALEAAPQECGEDARMKVRQILAATNDSDAFVACLRLLPDAKGPKLFARLEQALREAEKAMISPAAHKVLGAMAEMDDERALKAFRGHIRRQGIRGTATVIGALHRHPKHRLVLALLPPLLDETNTMPPFLGTPVPIWMSSRHRLCDWAAHVIATVRPDLRFVPNAPESERDACIAAMRKALARER